MKQTPALLPHCHPVRVTGADVFVEPDEPGGRLRVETTVRAIDRTGVEMEALTAAAVAALSLYDTARRSIAPLASTVFACSRSPVARAATTSPGAEPAGRALGIGDK